MTESSADRPVPKTWAGLTQQQLSEKIGINQAVLSRIETGKANPSIVTLQKLAKGLGKKLIIDFQ